MTRSPHLCLRSLGRRFGATTALENVDLDAARGEIVALLGENGAGKSTLVEVLAGRLRLDHGSMAIDDRPYRPRDARDARRAGIGVVHQHFQTVDHFTVAENLRLAGADARSLGAEWRRLADDLDLELPDLAAPVHTLGVGQRQWLEIGRALLWRPTVLLLDEPTAVLTPREAARLFATVRRLAEDGAAILFITHRLDEVRAVADRVVILRRGRAVHSGPASESRAGLARLITGDTSPVDRRTGRRGGVVVTMEAVAEPPRLHPVDLTIHGGEITVLAGVDGNGQTVLAERIGGLRTGPGTITIRGRRAGRVAPSEMRRLGVHLIPADRSLHGVAPSLTVAENIELVCPGLGPEAVSNLLADFSIRGRPEQPAGELSGGNQQKVVVARCLAAEPEVVVAIHPTRGLDFRAQQHVRGALFAAAADGRAVLAVTSDLEEARTLGDRLLVFSRGRIVGEGHRDTDADTVAAWFAGEIP